MLGSGYKKVSIKKKKNRINHNVSFNNYQIQLTKGFDL